MIFSLRKSAVVSLEQNIFDHDKLAIVPVGGDSAISLIMFNIYNKLILF